DDDRRAGHLPREDHRSRVHRVRDEGHVRVQHPHTRLRGDRLHPHLECGAGHHGDEGQDAVRRSRRQRQRERQREREREAVADMTSIGKGAAKRPRSTRAAVARASREQGGRTKGLDTGTGWTIFSYLIAGIVAYGAIGWGIGKATGIGLLFPLGMGLAIAVLGGYALYRYGRQWAPGVHTLGDDAH